MIESVIRKERARDTEREREKEGDINRYYSSLQCPLLHPGAAPLQVHDPFQRHYGVPFDPDHTHTHTHHHIVALPLPLPLPATPRAAAWRELAATTRAAPQSSTHTTRATEARPPDKTDTSGGGTVRMRRAEDIQYMQHTNIDTASRVGSRGQQEPGDEMSFSSN